MRKIKIITIILAIVLVAMVAFFGVYTHVQNRMEDQVKEYSYGMDLKGARNVRLVPSKEETTVIKDSEGKEVTDADDLSDEELAEKGYTKETKADNDESVLNIENYSKSKEIIEDRFKQLNIEQYNISVDESTGDILIELIEDSRTDNIVSNAFEVGKFEIVDSTTRRSVDG